MTYHQDTEYALAREILAALDDRTTVDVGAEKGSFVDACLAAGAARVFALEPYPPHVAHLRQRYSRNDAVRVLDVAVGAGDGPAVLHVAFDREGRPMDYHHSLVAFADTEDVQWKQHLEVSCRSLGSLVRDGTLPRRPGLLKVDTDGGDLAVIEGWGAMEPDVVLLEFGRLGEGVVGSSPYSIADLAALLRPQGYGDLAFVKRHDEMEVVQIGVETARVGDWGNVFFLHERVRDRLLPIVRGAAASVHDRLVDRALWFRDEASKRAEVIEDLKRRVRDDPPGPAPTWAGARPWIAAAPPGERERLLSGHPRISIVTPSYGYARFLEETIRSVLEQGYPNLEYVVIDGGSQDGSVDVIRRYEDRLAYWVSERDGGQADALNKGFARCTGDIVAWINSDDYYYPGAFAAAALAFRADPDLGFAYGRGNRVAEDGTVVREFEYTRPFDADALVYGVDYILQPTVFMRRSALHAVGPFDPDLHYAFDWDLWIRLARRFPVGRLEVSRIVAAGREHDSAKTFIGGFPRCEEIRRIVGRHTGEELTVGSLAYYLMSLVQTLPGADVPDSGELRSAAMALLGEVHELLMSNRVRRGTTARRLESLPDRDGWVGRELRVRRAVPEESRWLCVRGIHVREVWEAAGPLVLRADLDGEPLGIGVVFVPGAFTISWPLPPGRPPGPHEREIVMRASSVSAATLCHPEDPRFLSFQLAELHFEAALPTGSLCAHAEPGGVGRAVARAYRREHASVEPYGDGWAGPELRLVRPWPRAARLLALSGAHDPAIVSVEETLVLWATVDGQPLGRGVVRAPGPFTLCWPLPVGGRSAPSPDVAEGHCEVTIRSATSVVPARFWPSDDYRELTFRFRALELLPTPPRGALTSSGP